MALKVGESLGDHAIVEDLQTSDVPRDNFGYREFDPEVGSKLGGYTVVDAETEGAEVAFVHMDGSPEGTSQKVFLKKG